MKKKLHNGFLLVAMLLATVGSYVSCKDYDEEAYSNMLGENSRLEELINAQVNALNGQIDVLEQAQAECKANCEAWKQQITAWQEYVENNYVTKAEYDAKVLEFAAAIADTKKPVSIVVLRNNEQIALNPVYAAKDGRLGIEQSYSERYISTKTQYKRRKSAF